MVDDTNKYGSAVIYTVYYTVAWLTTRTKLIWKCCNLRRLLHRGMVDDMNKYGSAVIYAVYYTVAWYTTRTNMEVLVSSVFL